MGHEWLSLKSFAFVLIVLYKFHFNREETKRREEEMHRQVDAAFANSGVDRGDIDSERIARLSSVFKIVRNAEPIRLQQ